MAKRKTTSTETSTSVEGVVEKPVAKKPTSKKPVAKKPTVKKPAKTKASKTAPSETTTGTETASGYAAYTSSVPVSGSPTGLPILPHVCETVDYTIGGESMSETLSSADFNATCTEAGQAIVDYIPSVLSDMSDIMLALRVLTPPIDPDEFLSPIDHQLLLEKPTVWGKIFGTTPRHMYINVMEDMTPARGVVTPVIRFSQELVSVTDLASKAITGLVNNNRTIVLLGDTLYRVINALTNILNDTTLTNEQRGIGAARVDYLRRVHKWMTEEATFSAVVEASNSVFTLAEIASELNLEVSRYMSTLGVIHSQCLNGGSGFIDAITPLVEMESTRADNVLKFYTDLCRTIETLQTTNYHNIRVALSSWMNTFKLI